jgi:uncharacterized protein CbrC (UPF0167 family)
VTDSPPHFAYYPDAIADGRVHPSDRECAACRRARGWISDAILHSASKPEDAYFCPWCIADGTAVRLFGGSFNELDDGAADDEAARIAAERTPSFETWQDWFWPTHCGVPAVYRGQPSGDELRAYPEAFAALLADIRQYDWGRDEKYVAEFIDGLGGGHVAYLFQCSSCGLPMVPWDAD